MESSNPVVEVAKTTSCCSGTNSSGPVVFTLPEQVTNVEAVVNGASTDMPDKASTTDESSLPASNCNSAHATNTAQTLPQSNPAMPKVTAQPTTATEPSVKSRSSREEKSRKKDDKSVDHVLRALNSLSTTEEKLAAMCKKYADFFDEHRKLQALQKQTEKRCSLLQREKEQLQAEHSKAILTRSRLENLCRELQRQNKAIKDESLLKVREEEEKRKEVSAKFQTTMNEITTLMQQNNDKNMKLRDDNIDMTSKLKNICEQYELRQQQVERISKQMQLEQQLSEAKLSKLKLEMAAERELLLKEKQQLLLELQQYQQRCTEFQATEMSLRNQISLYNDKYDEFQKALARSNDVFGGFKGEMEKMSKKICKLEKETSSWKQRWERSHNALLEMAADKQKSEQELAMVSRQLVTLQSLCRTLQTERSSLLSKLKLLQGVGSESQGKCILNSPDICNKQCSQALNLTESLNVAEKPTSEGDQTLNHCPHNLQSSLEGSETVGSPLRNDVIDSTEAVANNIETLVPKPEVSDVVGTSNVCDLVVNNVLVERLENINITPNMQLTVDSCSSNQPLSVPIVGEINKLSSDSGADQTVFNAENPPADTPSVPVLNGDTLLNGSCPTDKNDAENLNNQQAEKPLVSHSSNESESKPVGKKSKETKKKKK